MFEEFEINSTELIYKISMFTNISFGQRVLCYSIYPNMLYISTSPIESFNRILVQERKKPLVDLLMGIRKVCSATILKQKMELLSLENGNTDILIQYLTIIESKARKKNLLPIIHE